MCKKLFYSISVLVLFLACLSQALVIGDLEGTFAAEPFGFINALVISTKVGTQPEPEPEPAPQPIDPGIEGLIASYAFENDTSDSSGNELHGTIAGDPVFVDGPMGMAMDFDGDYVDCGNSPLFDVTEQLTVAA